MGGNGFSISKNRGRKQVCCYHVGWIPGSRPVPEEERRCALMRAKKGVQCSLIRRGAYKFYVYPIACDGSRALSQHRVLFVISAFYQVCDQDFGPRRRKEEGASAVSETRPLLPWSHQCVAGLLGRIRISDGGGNEGGGVRDWNSHSLNEMQQRKPLLHVYISCVARTCHLFEIQIFIGIRSIAELQHRPTDHRPGLGTSKRSFVQKDFTLHSLAAVFDFACTYYLMEVLEGF
ncbi:hypothetical protein EVAR_57593_1 [Eumeta japonica]|uniref:Uncharacterized protein n=1 Tax=Eumeta variegata TaxID=151549 RepID=A0A4C1Y144_EUMVA|nr:hypothetical protein EVAR_57593_1 [Eumeta japonica]